MTGDWNRACGKEKRRGIMWTREASEQKLLDAEVPGECWGRYGRDAVARVERELRPTFW